MRAYRKRSGIFDPLPVARPVNQGGWGALEAAFRYSRLDLTDGKVDGGEMDILSLGINWWLARRVQFSVVTTFGRGYHWPHTLTGTNILEKRCENTDFSDLP
jgi:phosphate-selective porin